MAELIQFAAFMRTQKSENVNESPELTMYIVQAFVSAKSFSDISKRRDCVTYVFVPDGF